jgi:hypothetical protein
MVSSTIDAFWLVLTMRAGVPAFAVLALAMAFMVHAIVAGCRRRPVEIRRAARGWIMSLIALVLIGCTVHFWNVLHAHVFFFLGLAGWIADRRRVRAAKPRMTEAYVAPTWPPAHAWPIAAAWPSMPQSAARPYAAPAAGMPAR